MQTLNPKIFLKYKHEALKFVKLQTRRPNIVQNTNMESEILLNLQNIALLHT